MTTRGVWTAFGEVLCEECSNFSGHSGVSWEKDLGNTLCDCCGAEVTIKRSIAAESELARELNRQGIPAQMIQTGGMFSAVEVMDTGICIVDAAEWEIADVGSFMFVNEHGRTTEYYTKKQVVEKVKELVGK